MTGFAAQDGAAWAWELRGVNARGLDLRLRLPEGLGALEAPLRALIGKTVTRGGVTLSLRLSRAGGGAAVQVNPDGLAGALQALALVQAAADDAGLAITAPSAVEVAGMRGVLGEGGDAGLPDADTLLADFAPVLAAFTAMRAAEGAAIAAVITAQIDRIATLTADAARLAAARTEAQADTLRANVARLTDMADLDAGRLAQELALLAIKADITEEIDRLTAHVAAARDLMAGGGPVGRKLDFLMQEFNREANTLCSKSGDATLTATGLDLKLVIDQMREQVQNLE